MSIRDSIEFWIKEGKLYELKLVFASDQIQRTMIISDEIYQLLNGPWEDDVWGRRCGFLRGTLEAFVKGQEIGVCLEPFKASKAYMGRLHRPRDEVWDIRSIDPSPGIRVFGRFAEKDVFVGLIWSPRSVDIPASQRLPLGPRESIEWKNAIIECKTKWTVLFPSYQPVHGREIDDYIGSNFISV
jgi:hypothetical protein